PAPYLTAAQTAELYRSSKAILREAGYVGAGTCEFLIGTDGTISFLEVNTRLQVEHPVTEEVTGIDLVREMFRIADGEELGYGDPEVRGHSFEFRINGEDPGRGFLPAPGTVAVWRPPAGPGVRVDSGVEAGTVIGPAWDSLLAKLVVTGRDRRQALERAARALAEFEVDGMATALPFHRAVVTDPEFAPEVDGGAGPFSVHTRWIETGFSGDIAPYAGPAADPAAAPEERASAVVEVAGRRIEVTFPAGLGGLAPAPAAGAAARPRGRRTARPGGGGAASGASLTSPMQGTVVAAAVADGDRVAEGDLVVVLEAMKMEQQIRAHRAGTVRRLAAEAGATLAPGAVICDIED
ncbi:ATP-binding protein, partial [Nocardiopsis trehalosi]|uniref:ATP-binding protein n=1 Tax=Nocardiopsis trehalosi TaxID=109329 RepID=UPI000AEB1166